MPGFGRNLLPDKAFSMFTPVNISLTKKKAVSYSTQTYGGNGFPSPADAHLDANLDIEKLLITHPASTFFMRVSGADLEKEGVFDQDLLVVDRSLKPSPGKFLIIVLDNQLAIRSYT